MSIGIIASQAFSPNKIATPALWLDANDPATIIAPGGLVSDWKDKSVNGNHATQSINAEKPLTGTNNINGLNAIAFDGVAHNLTIPGVASIIGSDNTLFAIADFGTPNMLTTCLFAWNEGPTTFANTALYCFRNTGATLDSLGAIGALTLVNQDITNTVAVLSFATNFGNTLVTKLNGTQVTSVSINSVPSVDTFTLGAELDSGEILGNFLKVNLGEIIMYDRLLNAAEITAVENYLSNKWITSIFPFVFTSDFSSDFS